MLGTINWPYPWLAKTGNRLAEYLQAQKLPASMALAADKGAGGEQLLKTLAQAALCTQKNACGICAGCLQMQEGIHPCYIQLDKPGIDEVRTVTMQLMQTQAQHKFLILNNLAGVHVAAINALLKLCEEPPANTYIFACALPEQMLPTLRSRFVFFPLDLGARSGFFANMPLVEKDFNLENYKKFTQGEKIEDPIFLFKYIYEHKPEKYFQAVEWLKHNVQPSTIFQAIS